jgi:hypothetical protein
VCSDCCSIIVYCEGDLLATSVVGCGVGLSRRVPGEANTTSIVVSKQKTTAEPAMRGVTISQSSPHD